MTTYIFKDEELAALQGKTVLITGCATGIGKATAQLAHKSGANLALGDWNGVLGQQLADELGERVIFLKCDVSVWMDILTLFQAAWTTFGTIHAVVSNAGVNTENLFEDEIDPDTGILMPPNLKPLEINLIGMLYAVKCAEHYFAKWPSTRCQIVLTGSAASFLDTPPLYLYCTAKAGLLGLLRSLRTQLIKKNITVNLICPWLTVTPMLLPEMQSVWKDLPSNEPEGVGRALLMPIVRPEVNGKAFFIAGHEILDFEEKLLETQPAWMGQKLSDAVNEGQRRLIP